MPHIGNHWTKRFKYKFAVETDDVPTQVHMIVTFALVLLILAVSMILTPCAEAGNFVKVQRIFMFYPNFSKFSRKTFMRQTLPL